MSNEQLYFDTLKKIARSYMTPGQIRRDTPKSGLRYDEYLELSYENLQGEAARAIKGKRRPRDDGP
jgi:hypothetical protein